LVFALARSGRTAVAPVAVGAYIGAAYWFTSSTSFANPAVTVGRAFTDTFAGIAPVSVPAFVIAQIVGLLVGVGLVLALYPGPGRTAGEVMITRTPAVASTRRRGQWVQRSRRPGRRTGGLSVGTPGAKVRRPGQR
jgi:hypothetical protein